MSNNAKIPGSDSAGETTVLRKPGDATVLVVDDEPDVVTYLQSVLEDAGINVVTAHDGDEALRVIRDRKIDLISLDLVMPRKSGIRLLVELRKNHELSRIPVIFVTGHAHDPGVRKDVTEALAGSTMTGPAMYLEKPVTPHGYLANICRILNLEYEADGPDEGRTDAMRREVRDLLDGADPEALAAALEKLKGGKT
jgi:CheY-like chemotaxis protein